MSFMNRLANVNNEYQNYDKHKRVLCVCSAGLLRSPTIAYVLSQDPFNYNTRAAGISTEYALIQVDEVLLKWADEVVCAEEEHAEHIRKHFINAKNKTIITLDVPDSFSYRELELEIMIRHKYKDMVKL